jgi:hypothetical protein
MQAAGQQPYSREKRKGRQKGDKMEPEVDSVVTVLSYEPWNEEVH